MDVNLAEIFKTIKELLIANGLTLLLILVVLVIIHFVIRIFMSRLSRIIISRLSKKEAITTEREKRVKTINAIFTRLSFMLLWGIGILIILSELDINIAPILTGLGIFGLALSFGAQTLVKDIISGVFILIENQIRVGDVAVINGTGGLVEEINLRTTILRDVEGTVHVFPNGSINTLSNRTKEWSACVLDIEVAYKEDPDRVMQVMREVDEELRADKEYSDLILEPMEIFGLDNFAESAIVIKARIKTKTLKQWTIARQYRLRLKKAFDKHDIEIPFPHMSLYFGEASKPFELVLNREGAKT